MSDQRTIKHDAAATPFETLVRWRRDVRHFRDAPVPEPLLQHLLAIADLAPSVGNSQPWRIVDIRNPALRARVRAVFETERRRSATVYTGEQAAHYDRLKLAGFDRAPVHLAVFVDEACAQGHGLGRQTMPETLAYSCVAMTTILWLAAQEAGLGLGWVSIIAPEQVSEVLAVPASWRLVGYLLLGWPETPNLTPELERERWQSRTPLAARYLQR